MTCLFIGGNVDGEVVEVDPKATMWRVSDKPERSFSLHGQAERIESCLYTKRAYRYGASSFTEYYFAASDLDDEAAHKRYMECQR